ncbi:MAG: hypothetical protein EZS28_025478 [Streblomastix strix]|uniref:XMAP215/Dis1/CLASP TOG domain-containing protein n=1 Tax=Streblomastix strix TaxID=222440 RepID=A0A5J4V8Z0_9EUKA|nr:MAG: hypothetical protein EZS28_025478 [Streblomastix strix]
MVYCIQFACVVGRTPNFHINFQRFTLETAFGTSQITPETIIKVHKKPGLLDRKDINVKKDGKTLAVELYIWIGQVVPEMLKSLNEQLLKDLTVAFEAVKGQEQPKAIKRIRSMEGVMIKEVDNDNGIQQQQSGQSNQLSVYDFIAPQEVLSQINGKTFNLFTDLKAEGKKAWEKPNLTQKLQLFPVIKTVITHPQVIQTFSPIGMHVLGQHLVHVVYQDTDQTIRDQAAQVIGVLSQITGIGIIEALIQDLSVPK